MATSLLRLGRLGSLKCLRVDSWAVPRTRPAALFCTQTQEPVKPAKKTKAAGKTADAPDDRAALLAYKTAVAFPVRLSEPGAFLAQPAGVPDAVVSSTAAASSQPAADPDVAQVIADTAPPVVDAAPPAVGPLVEAISTTPVPAAAATNAAATEVAATEDAVPAATASSEPGDAGADGTSSSSSSNSDSDSDSDSEDEKSEVKPETKSSTAEPALKEEAVQEVMGDTNEGQKEPEASLLSGPEVVQEAAAAPAVSPEELVDSASEIRSGPEVTDPHVPADAAAEVIEDAAPPSVPDAREDTAAEVLAKAATPEQTLADSPVETTEPAGDKAAEDALAEAAPEPAEAAPEPAEAVPEPTEAAPEPTEAAPEPTEAAPEPTEAAPEPTEAAPEPAEAAPEPTEAAPEAPAAPSEAAAELCAPVDSTEELVDSAPVVAEAAGEELQMEAPAEPSEEAAAAPPEPEEPFDNSTYKNQQHHSYTPYTFADLDLEMAKFRLPQPSSGRPSPQH